MATANKAWGAPRIHGELLKLGIDIGERSVSRFMPPRPGKLATGPRRGCRVFRLGVTDAAPLPPSHERATQARWPG